MIKFIKQAVIVIGTCTILLGISCKKSETGPSDSCQGKNIVVSGTVKAPGPCGSDGTITAAATGSSGFTIKLDPGGNYQSNPVFNDLKAGDYTLFAKDGDGCEKSTSITVAPSNAAAGVLFTNVKTLMAAKCQGCHNNANQSGGMNWQVDCNIVAFKTRIKVRAVDVGDMPKGGPSLTTAEKAIITDWINAGGKFTD